MLLIAWTCFPLTLSLSPFYWLSQRASTPPPGTFQTVATMEPSNGVDIEPPNLIDNNLTREEKPPATTTVPEPKPKLPEEVEKWSREWQKVG